MAVSSGTAPPILVATGVTKKFGGLVAVDSVDLQIETGSITSVIGPNGAGKTTFFNMIAGIYKPTEGTISYKDKPIFGGSGFGGRSLRPDQVTSMGIARTFQNIRLFSNMSAIDNVLIGMHCRLKTGTLGAFLRTPKVMNEEREAREAAYGLLDYVGLGGIANVTAKNLAYGDQRRLEVARALASQPGLLLLDEPTAGMNPRETSEMTSFINRLRRDLNVTVLLIEHDMKVVMGISDKVAVLDHGIKIADGTGSEVRSNPQVIEAYLGKGAAELSKQFDATPSVEGVETAVDGTSDAEVRI